MTNRRYGTPLERENKAIYEWLLLWVWVCVSRHVCECIIHIYIPRPLRWEEKKVSFNDKADSLALGNSVDELACTCTLSCPHYYVRLRCVVLFQGIKPVEWLRHSSRCRVRVVGDNKPSLQHVITLPCSAARPKTGTIDRGSRNLQLPCLLLFVFFFILFPFSFLL